MSSFKVGDRVFRINVKLKGTPVVIGTEGVITSPMQDNYCLVKWENYEETNTAVSNIQKLSKLAKALK